ncbi:MAG: glycosyltransferase family 4 protein [Sumerlaeia bacterium]
MSKPLRPRFLFAVWTPLHDHRANTIMIVNTAVAMARTFPDWQVELRCTGYPVEPPALLASMGLEQPSNLEFALLFPGASEEESDDILKDRSAGRSTRRRREAITNWRADLTAGAAGTVIYTRNIPVVGFFRDVLENRDLKVPLLLELHQLKATKKWEEEVPGASLAAKKARVREAVQWERGRIALADYVFCISEPLLRQIESSLPPGRAGLLPSAVRLESAEPPDFENRDLDLLYTGQLYPWKGFHIALRALRLCDPAIRLTVIGGNSPSDLYCAKKFANNWGLAGRIDWLGQLPHSEVLAYQRRAKIGLIPLPRGPRIARFYTSPIKLFELMASGAALVASGVPSLRSMLEDEREALFAAPDDEREWAAAIERILSDEERRLSLARAAWEKVASFRFETRAARIGEAVEALLGAREAVAMEAAG